MSFKRIKVTVMIALDMNILILNFCYELEVRGRISIFDMENLLNVDQIQTKPDHL